MALCIFCGPTTEKMTKEHLWPKWVKEHHHRHGIGVGGYKTRRRRTNEGLRVYGTKGIELTARVVCEKCNQGWLSALEGHVKPLAIPLMLGQQHELTAENQVLLSTWISKLAMLYEHTGQGAKFFNQTDRSGLMERLEPPEDVEVWLASYVGPRALILSQHSATEPEWQSELDKFQVISGAVDRLAFQLVARRWKEPRPSDLEMEGFLSVSPWSPVATATWALATVRLWPVTTPCCSWPPRMDVDFEGFRQFADRWAGQTIF